MFGAISSFFGSPSKEDETSSSSSSSAAAAAATPARAQTTRTPAATPARDASADSWDGIDGDYPEDNDIVCVADDVTFWVMDADRSFRRQQQRSQLRVVLSRGTGTGYTPVDDDDDEDPFAYYLSVFDEDDTCICRARMSAQLQLQFQSKHRSMIWYLPHRFATVSVKFGRDTSPDAEHAFKTRVLYTLEEVAHRRVLPKSKRSDALSSYLTRVGEQDDETPMEVDDEDDEVDDDEEAAWLNAQREQGRAMRARQLDEQRARDEDAAAGSGHTGLAVGKARNLAIVTRGKRLGIFKCDDDNNLQYLHHIKAINTLGDGDAAATAFTPTSLQFGDQSRQLLMLNTNTADKSAGTGGGGGETLYRMDVEVGKVTGEFRAGTVGCEDVFQKVTAIAESFKNSEVKGGQESAPGAGSASDAVVKCINSNRLFEIDMRIAGSASSTGRMGKAYGGAAASSRPNFSCIAVNARGQMAVGSERGEVRLYSDVGTQAKTCFPGLGDAIIGIDVSENGMYVLATTAAYILLYPTALPNGDATLGDRRTGFDVAIPLKDRPVPRKLQIHSADLAKLGIARVSLTPAKFDCRERGRERFIVSSMGPFVITWDFKRVRKGDISAYKIERAPNVVVGGEFRYDSAKGQQIINTEDSVLTTNSR